MTRLPVFLLMVCAVMALVACTEEGSPDDGEATKDESPAGTYFDDDFYFDEYYEDQIRDDIYSEAYAEGYREGQLEGKEIGYDDGYLVGYDDGYDDGVSDGCRGLGENLLASGALDWYYC
jgi:flagellar biosynthesis/type III secretory pathway protein FliH